MTITMMSSYMHVVAMAKEMLTWMNWMVRADLPTPPPPTTTSLYSVRSLDAAMLLCGVCVCVCMCMCGVCACVCVYVRCVCMCVCVCVTGPDSIVIRTSKTKSKGVCTSNDFPPSNVCMNEKIVYSFTARGYGLELANTGHFNKCKPHMIICVQSGDVSMAIVYKQRNTSLKTNCLLRIKVHTRYCHVVFHKHPLPIYI